MSLLTIIAVASGGAIGATLRLFIYTIIDKHYTDLFPLGTLSVNLIGSLLIGMLVAYFQLNTALSSPMKTFMVTGILGALTTYSTFAIESFFLLEAGDYAHAFVNIVLNVAGTIFFAGMGYLFILKLGN